MKTITLIIALSVQMLASAQQNVESRPWNDICQSMDTDLAMDTCSTLMYKMADSLMNDLFLNLAQRIDSEIQSVENDSTNKEDFTQYVKKLEKQKKLLEASQSNFIEYRKSVMDFTSEFIGNKHISRFYIFSYGLGITKDRINTLEAIGVELLID